MSFPNDPDRHEVLLAQKNFVVSHFFCQNLTAVTVRRPKLLRDPGCTHLIEVLRVDLPEAAGGRLAERDGPVRDGLGAGVGPGPVSWWDLQPRGRRGTAGGPAERGGRGLAQRWMGRSRSRNRSRSQNRSRGGAEVHGLTADPGVVEVLFSLGLIRPTAACDRRIKVWTFTECCNYVRALPRPQPSSLSFLCSSAALLLTHPQTTG